MRSPNKLNKAGHLWVQWLFCLLQFTENNFLAILAFSLLYYFFVLGKQKEKGKLASIQILGVILVWSLVGVYKRSSAYYPIIPNLFIEEKNYRV
ncbi:hypothetical protein BKP37_14590 [Anaerobacillus alkalilacustris]|uniref:Uncharacterized protein n=1 Tax=Anaerobacillus alkalilacustris TaxID=393763 RepID=A0A1S2LJ16_9BACI|nr:hypothetical protein BKP37_14590 [Anaerobacillus alkalilacustris]